MLREYDAANRLTAEVHREAASGIDNRTEFGYDAAGNLVEITDSQGRKTRIAYDLMNREIRRIERDGGVQRTIYDRNGQVVRLDPAQRIRRPDGRGARDSSSPTTPRGACSRCSARRGRCSRPTPTTRRAGCSSGWTAWAAA